jgi:hypothetical protein
MKRLLVVLLLLLVLSISTLDAFDAHDAGTLARDAEILIEMERTRQLEAKKSIAAMYIGDTIIPLIKEAAKKGKYSIDVVVPNNLDYIEGVIEVLRDRKFFVDAKAGTLVIMWERLYRGDFVGIGGISSS